VEVNVVLYPCSGYLADVYPDVEPFGVKGAAQGLYPLDGEFNEVQKLFLIQILKAWDMPERDHHKVSAVVGVEVQHYAAFVASIEDVIFSVLVVGNFFAKDTVQGLRGKDVFYPPRTPKPLHELFSCFWMER
jgi:hypothetical protein